MDEIWDLIESVSEGFPTCSLLLELVLLMFVLKDCYYRTFLGADKNLYLKNNKRHFLHMI